MSEESACCEAVTQAGTRCKNSAMAGLNYCYVHRNQKGEEAAPKGRDTAKTTKATTKAEAKSKERETPKAETQPLPQPASPKGAEPRPPGSTGAAESRGSASMSEEQRAEFETIAAELNRIAAELEKESRYAAPELSAPALAALVEKNIYRFTPEAQREMVLALRNNLRGTKPSDLIDPDTWRGFWYVFNYMTQDQRRETSERLGKRLESVPGMALLSDLREGMRDASPKDFLDPDTWKGLALVTNMTVRAQVNRFRDFILGRDDE